MEITRLEEAGRKQVRVYLDLSPYCLLYTNEVHRLGYEEGQEINQEDFSKLNALLLLRGKKKVLALLKHQDRTFGELEERLSRLEYPAHIIKESIDYAASYGYLDDEAYVRRYLEFHGENKSRLEILRDLKKKRVSGELIDIALKEYEGKEDEVLAGQVEKRIRQKGEVTQENFQKYYAYFARKGFSSHLILDILKGHMK